MGFYDCRCMITGVSLKRMTTIAVVLQRQGNRYVPATCGVDGGYDRYGSFDGIYDNDNTARILTYFQEQLRAGAFVINEAYFRVADRYPLNDIELLLWGFERNLNDGPGAAMLREEPLFCALICGVVWDALVGAALPDRLVATWMRKWFERAPVAAEIYGAYANELADYIGELSSTISLAGVNSPMPRIWK